MSINPSAFGQREATQQRAAAVSVKVTRCAGFVMASGSGEGTMDVTFPNWFMEKPAMSFGGELSAGGLVNGQFPTVSVVVVSWVTQVRSLATVWTGARLAIVTTGPSTQTLTVHWQAEGKALAVPGDVGAVNTTGSA